MYDDFVNLTCPMSCHENKLKQTRKYQSVSVFVYAVCILEVSKNWWNYDCTHSHSRRRRGRKIQAQAWSLCARLFNIQELQYSTSKQFL